MLSFQVINRNKTIQIDLDREGMGKLIAVLDEFKASDLGHVHLRAPSAGGSSLSDKTPWGAEAVGEVIISLGGNN
jgi:hypothetical protein